MAEMAAAHRGTLSPSSAHATASAKVTPKGLTQRAAKLQQRPAVQRLVQLATALQPAPAQRRANRTGLPDGLKSGVESLSGQSLDDVKVHYNSSAPSQLGAYAHTQGTAIHVGPGQERHLPHEAWHVAQQKQGRVVANTQVNGTPVNDSPTLEREADVMGSRAAQAQT